jgi:hypothetical protein
MAIPRWDNTDMDDCRSRRLDIGQTSLKAGHVRCCVVLELRGLRLWFDSALYVVDLVRFRQVGVRELLNDLLLSECCGLWLG